MEKQKRKRRRRRKQKSVGFTPRFIQEIAQHSPKDIRALLKALGR